MHTTAATTTTSPVVPYRTLLAKDILRDHFGEMVQRVGTELIDHGMLTLRQLFTKVNSGHFPGFQAHGAPAVGDDKYSFAQIRNALIVMVQHNFIRFFTEREFLERANKALDDSEEEGAGRGGGGGGGRKGGGGWGNRAAKERDMQRQFEQQMQQEAEREAERDKKKRKGSKTSVVTVGSNTGSSKKKTPAAAAAACTSSSAMRRAQMRAEAEGPVIYYELDLINLLMRFKFSLFLSMVRERHGTNGELMLDSLLTHGRLSKESVVQNVTARLLDEEIHTREENEELEMSDYERAKFMEDTRAHLEPVFDELVKGRFVSVVQPWSLADDEQEGPRQSLRDQVRRQQREASEKRKRKRSTSSEELEEGEGKEQEEEESTTKARSKKRRRIIEDDDDNNDIDDANDDVDDNDIATDSNARETTQEESPSPAADLPLFCVNYDQFIRICRHEAIVKYVGEKVNATAATIVRTMMSLTINSEKTPNPVQSSRVQFSSLLQEINSKEGMSGKNLQLYLDRMAKDGNEIVTQSSTGSYVLNMGQIADAIKMKYAESLIENKFGIIGSRIFRLLVTKKQLEQKQVAEYAMIPVAEARSLLYRMFLDRITQVQEVSKAHDHNPARTFYLWNVKLSVVYDRMQDTLFKTMRNLRMRLAKEQRDALDTIGGGLLGNINNLSAEQQQYLKRLEKVEDRLENSIIHLNETLLCFETF